VQCTKNRQLEAILMSALDRHQRPLYLGLDVGIDGQASTDEHLEIAEAVKTHDREPRAHADGQAHRQAEDRIVVALRAAGF
jgi:DNA-binding GntR family transcriptional regulator